MTRSHARIAADELAGTTESLRALARGLVRDAAAAEDVAQEAWLAALEGTPPQDVPLRWWLRGVARHVAFRFLRTESRRRRREALVARPESVAAGAEAAARRAETHRRLVDAVLSLPEPYRGAMLLRWFEELTPSEIAARTGEKPGTVRMRLLRGLGLLRERLDREERGDRKAWALALLPLCAGRRMRTAAAIAAGGVAVKTMTKLTIAAALLLLAAGASAPSLFGPSQVETAPATSAHETVSAAPRPRRVPREAEPEPEPEPPAAPDPSEASLSVVVTAWDGAPIPGARVEVFEHAPPEPVPVPGAAPASERKRLASAATNARGSAVLAGIAPSARVVLVASAPGFARRSDPESAPGAGETRDIRVRLLPACDVTGRVRTPGGAPVADVLVEAGGVRVVSDEEGRFELRDLEWGVLEIRAARPGGRLLPAAAARLPIDGEFVLVLPEPARLAGTVRDARTGLPIAGARVSAGIAYGMQGEGSATTGADGRYVIDSLPEGVVNKIEVHAAGHLGAGSPPGANPRDLPVRCGETTTADFVLEPGERPSPSAPEPPAKRLLGAVIVRVIDTNGAPVVGARVAGTTTGADGSSRIEGVTTDKPLALTIDADGFGRGHTVTSPVAAGADTAATVTLERAPIVRGVARRADGAALPAGALVQVLAFAKVDDRHPMVVIAAEARGLGRGGEFEIPVPWTGVGSFRVTAWAPGLTPGSSPDTPIVAGQAAYALDVTIPTAATVRGIVLDAATGQGIEGVPILASAWRPSGGTASLENPSVAAVATTDRTGRFVATGLVVLYRNPSGDAGRTSLGVSMPGFEPLWTDVTLPQDGDATIRLVRMKQVAGIVVWEDGSPAGGVRVDAGTPTLWSVTSPDGRFRFGAAGDAALTLRVSGARPGDDVRSESVPNVKPGDPDLRIVVRRGSHISGRVLVEGGRGVGSCIVIATLTSDRSAVFRAMSSSDGSFRLGGLPDGAFDLAVRLPENPYPPDVANYRGPRRTGVVAGTEGLVLELVK